MKIQFGKTSRCKSQLQLAALGCSRFFIFLRVSCHGDLTLYGSDGAAECRVPLKVFVVRQLSKLTSDSRAMLCKLAACCTSVHYSFLHLITFRI